MMVTLISITVTGSGLLAPTQLPELVERVEKALPSQALQGLVGVSGRLPIWAACAVAHALHPARAVGTFDPRLGGVVVVESHHPDYRVGDVVPVEGAQVVKVSIEGT